VLTEIARDKGATLAQLAIAWVLAPADDILALLGCRTPEQMQDALKAATLTFTTDDWLRIESILSKDKPKATTCRP
jgi:aryl-alcohol dehydrogenase-like predicted oxidoreductase